MVTVNYGIEFQEQVDLGTDHSNESYSSELGLSGGGHAVVYGERFGSATIRINGIERPFAVDTGLEPGSASVTELANGNIAVTWKGTIANSIFTTVLDPTSGLPIGDADNEVSSGAAFKDPCTTALANGTYVVTYSDGDNIFAKVMPASGTPAGSQFQINPATAEAASDPTITTLVDGRFIVGYTHGDAVVARIFNANGTPSSGEITISTDNAASVRIDAFPDGRWAAVYESGADINLRIFDASGAVLSGSSPIVVASETDAQLGPGLTILSNGFIMVDWATETYKGKYEDFGPLQALVLDTNGQPLAGMDSFTVNGSTTLRFLNTTHTFRSTTALQGGEFIHAFVDNQGIGFPGDPGSYTDYLIAEQTRQIVRTSNGHGSDNDVIVGDDLADRIFGNDGNDDLTGGAGDDKLYGGNGDDVIRVLAGDDDRSQQTYDGGNQVDTLVVTGVHDLRSDVAKNFEFLDLSGSGTQVTLSLAQVLPMTVDSDGPDGGTKLTVLMGATSSFDFRSPTFKVDPGVELVIQGDFSDETIDGTEHAEDIVGDAGTDRLSGNGGDDSLFGGSSNDTLAGGLGADYLSGGTGTDTADYSSAAAGIGISLTNASSSTGGAAGDTFNSIEYVEGSSFSDTVEGTNAVNKIVGYGGDDVIKGLNGADTLIGESGADKLYGGNDGDTLDGGGEADLLQGDAGADVLNGGFGADKLYGGSEADTLDGGADADLVDGGSGDDILTGGAGADTLKGQAGIDTVSYTASFSGITASLIDSSKNAGDAAGDTFSLIENIDGSALADNLTGDLANNILKGNAGNDVIAGNDGDDLLVGAAGDDRLDAGLGLDTLDGGAGNDIYLVSDAADVVIETYGNGADRVMARVSYTLASNANIETLTTNGATGTSSIDLTGNKLQQYIIGNDGSNILHDGGGGSYTLSGQGGNDTYIVYAQGMIVEGASEGTLDRLSVGTTYVLNAGAYIEQISTTSAKGTTAIDLTGNEVGQTIIGNAGSNVINGQGGLDTITGGGGADTFVFSTAFGSNNVTKITDFSATADTINLDNAIFKTLTVEGVLTGSAFWASASGAAHDASDRIIYETDTGKLWYDEDGTDSEPAIHFATLQAGLTLTAADFVVI